MSFLFLEFIPFDSAFLHLPTKILHLQKNLIRISNRQNLELTTLYIWRELKPNKQFILHYK